MNKKSRRAEGSPSFETMLKQLMDIVRDLEEGELSLDESLAKYEQGIRHLSRCQKLLSAAERKIEILHGLDAEGNPVTRAFHEDDMSLAEKAQRRSQRRSASPRRPAPPAPSNPKASDDDEDDINARGTLF